MALRLFGCWADLAKDSLPIRYAILSTLQSSHVSEVKASLFAAGCFCQLSEDFACIVLGILVHMICSLQASSDVVFAAVHAFSKVQCSSSVASRAYKAGKQLLLDSLQDELKAEMLSSLSKLAFKSTTLIVEQVDLLISFLSHESSSSMKARALKCLYLLIGRGALCVSVNGKVLAALFYIIDDNDIPVIIQYEALRILCKIFCSMPPDMPCVDLPDFLKLVLTAKRAAQTSDKVKRGLALGLLVDVLCSIKRARRGHWLHSVELWNAMCSEFEVSLEATFLASSGDGLANIVCQVTSLIIDYISSLIKQAFVESDGEVVHTGKLTSYGSISDAKQCKSFLSLILHLAEEYPFAGLVALDKIRYLMQSLGGTYDKFNMENTSASGEAFQAKLGVEKLCCFAEPPGSDNQQISIASKLILCMLRFTNACLNVVIETGTINSELCQILKLLAEYMQKSRSFSCNTFEFFRLGMHAYIACYLCGMTSVKTKGADDSKVGASLGFFCNVCWVGMEWRTLEFAKNMLKRRNYWAAYRAGKYSCCEGLWFAATFIFRKLIDGVQSDSSRCWLKSLMLLAGGESEIKLFLFPKAGVELISGLQIESNFEKPFTSVEEGMGRYVEEKSDLHDFEGKLARIYCRICSAEETLAASRASVGVYYFHRWFISLRAKFLEILMDMLGILNSHTFTEANCNKEEGNAESHVRAITQNMNPLIFGLANISSRLHKLAKDYDLLATSFLDIDRQSHRNISRLALSCSVLAFCSAFALHFSNLAPDENAPSSGSGKLEKFLRTIIIKDVVERLWNIDNKISVKLQHFVTYYWEEMDNFQSRTQIKSSGHMERASLGVLEFAISGVLQIQEDSRVKDGKDLQPLFMRGLQLLSDMTRHWMEIPFKVPKYFFSIRPCIGAELFLFNADSRNKHDLSVSRGFQLSLNLCLQLKNAMIESVLRIAKMHCILAVRPSDRLSIQGGKVGQMQGCFHPCKTDEMVELNEMLLLHIKAETSKTDMMNCEAGNGVNWVTAYVCFEPNEKGQGFSSCLLNVSAFPEGSYQIKWHSCCIDDSGSHRSLLPLNAGALFTIIKP